MFGKTHKDHCAIASAAFLALALACVGAGSLLDVWKDQATALFVVLFGLLTSSVVTGLVAMRRTALGLLATICVVVSTIVSCSTMWGLKSL